ncbi:hypothetical protein ACS0TY_004105 [Phlomoides rotata]
MAAFLFSSPLAFNIIHKPGPISCRCTSRKANWIDDSTCRFKSSGFEALKATDNEPSSKTNSILCVDCEGNGAKKCGQCEGKGVNLVDHFNGQFKAGASCWLCSGKKEVLCGNCNGAGFMGGFMSTFDE